MLEFKQLTLSSRSEIAPYLQHAPVSSGDRSFIELFMWEAILGTEFAIFDDMLFIRYTRVDLQPIYKMPIGPGDIEKALSLLPLGARLFLQEAHLDFVAGERAEYRDSFEYVYSVDKLISLSGKALAKKRNNFNKFAREYAFFYEDMTKETAKDCGDVYDEWFVRHKQRDSKLFSAEKAKMQFILNNFKDFNVKGGILYVGAKIVAFTLAESIDENSLIVHIEKASPDYMGAYVAINKLHLEHAWADKKYVNRLDDAGLLGLRKAKMEYNPEFFIKKYMARR